MIKYVAFMKLKDDTPPDKLGLVEGQLRVLGKIIPEVAKWSCGRCLRSQGSSTDWTFVIVADFKDEHAYQRYREHPEHQAFRKFAAPYRERSVSMHYEARYPRLTLIRYEGGVPAVVPHRRLPPLDA